MAGSIRLAISPPFSRSTHGDIELVLQIEQGLRKFYVTRLFQPTGSHLATVARRLGPDEING